MDFAGLGKKRIQGLGFRVWSLGLRVQSLGFRISCSELEAQDFRIRTTPDGFRGDFDRF